MDSWNLDSSNIFFTIAALKLNSSFQTLKKIKEIKETANSLLVLCATKEVERKGGLDMFPCWSSREAVQ